MEAHIGPGGGDSQFAGAAVQSDARRRDTQRSYTAASAHTAAGKYRAGAGREGQGVMVDGIEHIGGDIGKGRHETSAVTSARVVTKKAPVPLLFSSSTVLSDALKVSSLLTAVITSLAVEPQTRAFNPSVTSL